MAETTILVPALSRAFAEALREKRVILFSAPCGFGKTAAARTLLRGSRCFSTAAGANFTLPAPGAVWQVLLVDELQELNREEDQRALMELIRRSPERRFVLLSRGVLPEWLADFSRSGMLQLFQGADLLLDRETVSRLLAAHGVQATGYELTAIHRETMGYPLAVLLLAYAMADGLRYGPETSNRVRRELYLYYESAVYRRLELPMRRLLLSLAPFERFDAELACAVMDDPAAAGLLEALRYKTTMLQPVGLAQYQFWAVFHDFLNWQLANESGALRAQVYLRAGRFYEKRGDDAAALECYAESGHHEKLLELLIRNAEQHPAMVRYAQLERFYCALPEEEILAHPALMQARSTLCALRMDFEGSERWYRALKQFSGSAGTPEQRLQAQSRVAWLDLALPQRGVAELGRMIRAAAGYAESRTIRLPSFSVTNGMPSILNGGKDFSESSLRDLELYQTLRQPLEMLLGPAGVGLADCALAECRFERGEDVGAQLLQLMTDLSDVQQHGTPDTEFAIATLLARWQIDRGEPGEARRTMQSLRRRFVERKLDRYLPNLDAALCRIALHMGDMETVDDWYREKAPGDRMRPDVLKRYQYLTQAMAELAQGRPDDALLTLAPLEIFCTACHRYLDGLHRNILRAIALRRKKDERWRKLLCAALDTAQTYQFIRPVSLYGTAVLPLLSDCGYHGDAEWFAAVVAAAREEAVFYPDYLTVGPDADVALTAAEMQVLRLLCADRSNAEIGAILNIRLATVKTHVSHVLQKLGVSRRSEARTAAQRLRLLTWEI